MGIKIEILDDQEASEALEELSNDLSDAGTMIEEESYEDALGNIKQAISELQAVQIYLEAKEEADIPEAK